MGSKERRERERVDTRQRIVDAARELFVRKGYEATTMRAIAQHIEYTPTAIYHHFRNKEALLTELSAQDFRALAQEFQRLGQVADPVERLTRIGQAYVQFAMRFPMHYQLMFMTRHPKVDPTAIHMQSDPTEDAYAFLLRTCEEAISAGRFRPELRDPQEVAQILWSGVHGLVSLHITQKEQKGGPVEWRDIGKTAAVQSDVMLRGLLRVGNP